MADQKQRVSAGAAVDDTEANLAKQIAAINSASGAGKAQLQVDLLSYIDEHRLRNASGLVASHGFAVLLHNAAHASFLGDGVWNLYERVCIAACDAHQQKIREECLAVLAAKFPQSIRVKRLTALRAEADGKYDEAKALYDQILTEQPANAFALKRRASVLRACGHTIAACDALSAYVDIFSSDVNAWEELSELYCSVEKYELAKFAMEELILLAPENYLYHLQYAEVLYTLGGGKPAIELARHYFSQSLELKPNNNARALYGLALCLRGVKSGDEASTTAVSTSKGSKTVNLTELANVTATALTAMYKSKAPASVPLVDAVLKQ